MKHKIEWKPIDEGPVEAAVCLLIPDDKSDFHLKTLSRLTRGLMYEDLANMLKTAEKQQISSEIIDTVS